MHAYNGNRTGCLYKCSVTLYEQEFFRLQAQPTRRMLSMDTYTDRMKLVQEYAWAIPNMEAIRAINTLGSFVEVGAGNGYWSWELRRAGGDVIPTDLLPPLENPHYAFNKQWLEVEQLSADQAIRKYRNHNLLTVWPCYDEDWSAYMLCVFESEYVVYVGEGAGGCTANNDFHTYLSQAFERERIIHLPQWYGIHDNVHIWKRK